MSRGVNGGVYSCGQKMLSMCEGVNVEKWEGKEWSKEVRAALSEAVRKDLDRGSRLR